MIKILLVIQDKNSADLIKALCLYKGCTVLVADNPRRLMQFLREETIDMVFLDNSSMYLSVLDMIFSVCDFDHEMPAILISDNIDKSEEIEMLKKNIFYRLVKPLNTEEIDAVIDAAIITVSTKMPQKESIVTEKMVAENPEINEQMKKIKPFSKTFNFINRNIQNSDRKIVYLIKGYKIEKLENTFGKIFKPVNKIDRVMTNLMLKIL